MQVRTSARLVRYDTPPHTDAKDRQMQIRLLKKGLPASAFEKLQEEIDVPVMTLAAVTKIAPRTLTRRKKEGRLLTDESERVLRLSMLFARAKEVLGDIGHARQWFKSPKIALGGKTPLEYADTEPGAREVEDLLGRLEHGVFS
jgi:putative toxin-antitoxin system antitoxin component (TIGR02293 family)